MKKNYIEIFNNRIVFHDFNFEKGYIYGVDSQGEEWACSGWYLTASSLTFGESSKPKYMSDGMYFKIYRRITLDRVDEQGRLIKKWVGKWESTVDTWTEGFDGEYYMTEPRTEAAVIMEMITYSREGDIYENI